MGTSWLGWRLDGEALDAEGRCVGGRGMGRDLAGGSRGLGRRAVDARSAGRAGRDSLGWGAWLAGRLGPSWPV